MTGPPSSSPLARFAPPLIVLALAAGFLAWSHAYDDESRQVPVLVGWCLVGLCLLDLIAASSTAAGRAVKSFFSGAIVGESGAEPEEQPPARVLVAMAWPSAFVACVALFGFVATIPVYVFLFVALQGRKGVRNALYASVSITAFIYVVFELSLRYEVYRGALFA